MDGRTSTLACSGELHEKVEGPQESLIKSNSDVSHVGTSEPQAGTNGILGSKITRPVDSQIPKDSPVAFREHSDQQLWNNELLQSSYRYYGNEARKWTLGPMPIKEFLFEFFPEKHLPKKSPNGQSMPESSGAFDSVPKKGRGVFQALVSNMPSSYEENSVEFY